MNDQELFVKIAETNKDIKYISKMVDEIKEGMVDNKTVLSNHETRLFNIEEKQKDVIAIKLDLKTGIAVAGFLITLIALKVV